MLWERGAICINKASVPWEKPSMLNSSIARAKRRTGCHLQGDFYTDVTNAGHRNKTETEESAEQASLNCPLSLTKRNFSYALG